MSTRGARAGATLIELMVALSIGLGLLTGVMQVYLASKTSVRLQQALARVQEAGRFAVTTLAGELRMTAHLGCMSIDRRPPRMLARTPGEWADVEPIHGYEGRAAGWHETPPAGVGRRALARTDVLELRHGTSQGRPLAAAMRDAAAALALPDDPGWAREKALLAVADCADADVFRVTATSRIGNRLLVAHDRSSNTASRLSKAYGKTALVMPAEHIVYYVATGPSGESALYRRASGRAAALVAGVEDMQLRYGEDPDGEAPLQAGTFVPADRVGDWSAVAAVRVALLIRSPQTVSTRSETVTFGGRDYEGRRLRRAFEITVALRNRVDD